jgi:uncharacterized protein (DUF1015 family)
VTVPRFQPFPGLRYSPSHISALDDVVCPPYDVISEADRRVLAGRSPSNVVRLEMPVSEDGDDPYRTAALLLDAWRDGGILHRDHDPALYGYRMTYRDDLGRDRTTIGVIGALALEPPGSGILPHEHTTPKARSDRLELLRATRTNLSPIWGLSPAPGLTELIGAPHHPAERTTDGEGVLHELWPITDREQVDDISDAVGDAPVLIADGHHRFETALAFQAEETARLGERPGDHEQVMALVVELAEEQLAVQAIHRLLRGLPDDLDIAAALARSYDLEPTGPLDGTITARMLQGDAVTLVTPAGVWLARASMRRGGGVRRGAGGHPPPPRLRGPDRRHQPRRGAHAGQDDVLLAQAPHGSGPAGAGRLTPTPAAADGRPPSGGFLVDNAP